MCMCCPMLVDSNLFHRQRERKFPFFLLPSRQLSLIFYLLSFASLRFPLRSMACSVPSDSLIVWCAYFNVLAFSYNSTHYLHKCYAFVTWIIFSPPQVNNFPFQIGNHSCEPNAEVNFPYNNSTLALKALSSIQTGEVPVLGFLFVNWY